MPAADGITAPIQTTLYDLIATMHAEVDPDEDELVVAMVLHVLRSIV